MTWARKTARSVVLVIVLFLIVLVVPSLGGNPINILHSFSGGLSDDGSQPLGSLLLSDSVLYGTTRDGGDGSGTVFSLNVDGSNFRIVHSFEGNDGGSGPYGSLILSGSTLYGTTCDGGEYYSGTIFSVDADGSNFQILHSFEPGPIWSCGIYGSLVISESTLYGMSYYGGSANSGAVFSVKTDGSDFQVLHSFFDSPSDGLNPTGNLTLVDSKLYGMTGDGGSFARGIIFSMDTNGSNFQILHSFGSGDDGSSPYGGLIVSGSTLYGMTDYGGIHHAGTIFSINTDGSNYQLLHSFAGPLSFSWDFHTASLALSGRTLYGMTPFRGKPEKGTIFSINTDGSNYQLLHSFRGGATDGSEPYGGITVSGSTLYGMTFSGGGSNLGTIFSFKPPTYLLDVVKSGGGTGKVASSPSGINCGPYCSTDYKTGTRISLTPVPESGSVFTGWTGGCTGKGACSVTITEDVTVGATFEADSCSYGISSSRRTFTYRGGTTTIGVGAKDYTFCVPPVIENTTGWITHRATPFKNNAGFITLTVPPLDTSAGRTSGTGAFTIAGKTFEVTQTGKPCTFALTPAWSPVFPESGDTGTFDIETMAADCTWKAVTDSKSSWITIGPGGEGSGSATVGYTVAANDTGKARSGKIVVTVAGKSKLYTVRQRK